MAYSSLRSTLSNNVNGRCGTLNEVSSKPTLLLPINTSKHTNDKLKCFIMLRVLIVTTIERVEDYRGKLSNSMATE